MSPSRIGGWDLADGDIDGVRLLCFCHLGLGFRVGGLGFGVEGLGFRVQNLGLRVEGRGFGAWGLGFWV